MSEFHFPISPLFVLLLLLSSLEINAQCNISPNSGSACVPRSNFYFGELVPSNGCGNFAVTNNYNNGQYFRMPVLEGGCYTISTCGSNFNSQLTLFQGTDASAPFAWLDDNGPACNGSESSVTFSPSFTDYTRVNVNSYNCMIYSPQSATVGVRQNNNLAFTSSSVDMCQGATRTLTATPIPLASAQPNSGDLGTFSGPGVVGNTFTAPPPSGTSEVFTVTYTFGYCSINQNITVLATTGSPANAGPDQLELTTITTNLAATPPVIGTGLWTIVSGAGASINDSSSPSALFTGVLGETYELQWTITDGSCVSSDNVILEFLPTFVNCDETLNDGNACVPRSNFYHGELLPNNGCESFSVTANYNNGQYFRMPVLQGGCYSISTCGSGFDTQLTLYQGPNTTSPFTWRDDNGPFCAGLESSLTFESSFSDYTRVNVNTYNCQVYVNQSATVSVRQNNNLGFLSSDSDICAGANRPLVATPTPVSIIVQSGSGDTGTFSGSGVTGSTFIAPTPTGTSQVFTLNYSFGYCNSTQDINVFSLPSTANAGPDQLAIPATSTPLAATPPAVGTGNWTVVFGIDGVIDNPSSPATMFSGILGNTYILRWTVSNGPCTPSNDDIIVEFFIPCDPPILTCPSDLTLECGDPTDPSSTGNAVGVSNCDPTPDIIFVDDFNVICAGSGIITRTWTITDLEGNMVSCDQILTIEDTTIPVVNCPADPPTSEWPSGFNTAPVPPFTPQDPSLDPALVGVPQIDENCGSPNVSYQDVLIGPAGNCSLLYAVTRTWTVTDPCGLVNSCVQTFLFEDTTAPDINCPSGILLPPAPFQETEPNDLVTEPGVQPLISESILTGTADATPMLDTWLIPDGSSGDITVQIQNLQSPVTVVTVNCYIDPARTILNTPFTYTPFEPPLVVTLDPVFFYTITVGDFIAGSPYEVFVTGPPLQTFGPLVPFECPAGLNKDAVPQDTPQDPVIDPSFTGIPEVDDNFNIASLSYLDILNGPDPVTCPLVWTVDRIWTVTDGCGLTATCTQTFEFEDTTTPTASCSTNTSITIGPGGNATLDALLLDNGSSDNCGIADISVSQSVFTCSDVGIQTVDFIVTDFCGLSDICPVTVIVINPMMLSGVVSDESGAGMANGAVDLSVINGNSPYGYLWSDGTTNEDISGLTGQMTYTVTVTDNFGCSITGSYFVDQITAVQIELCVTAYLFSMFDPFAIAPAPPLTTTLRDQDLIPLAQPFSVMPWNYSGTEAFPSYAIIPMDMTEWLLLRLRASNDPGTVVYEEAVVLHSDGTLKSVNGSFPNIFIEPLDDYWLELVHINHLPVFTQGPLVIPLGGGQICYDFTTSISQAYSNPILNDEPMMMMPSVNGTFYGMIPGNAQNLDCQVEANDLNLLFTNYLGAAGYVPWDINRDGITDINDINMLFSSYSKIGHKPF